MHKGGKQENKTMPEPFLSEGDYVHNVRPTLIMTFCVPINS